MGDRAMAQIHTETGDLYFYTHWCGSSLPEIAQIALDVAKPRKGDDSYALRIVLDRLIFETGARDREVGAGVMMKPVAEDEHNGGDPSVVIDLRAWTVKTVGRMR